jgi:hypothetical protein
MFMNLYASHLYSLMFLTLTLTVCFNPYNASTAELNLRRKVLIMSLLIFTIIGVILNAICILLIKTFLIFNDIRPLHMQLFGEQQCPS